PVSLKPRLSRSSSPRSPRVPDAPQSARELGGRAAMPAKKSAWGWPAGLPAHVAPAGFDPRLVAAGGDGGQDLQSSLAAPRGEEVPWPVGLARVAGSEEDATSSGDAPAFRPRTKCQRRRRQRKLSKAMAQSTTTRGDVPCESLAAPSGGCDDGGLAGPTTTEVWSSADEEPCP
ncbi:unnamed protein product, partial [Prorocentrum cordatum]